MLNRLLFRVVLLVFRLFKGWPKWAIVGLLLAILALPFAGIAFAKIYQSWDRDPARGAIAISGGAFGETYERPEYLDQGWEPWQSLWFYNTTQGSALLPYDFLLALEQPGTRNRVECDRNGETGAWFLCDANIDRLRYLPQSDTFFNPDALPVGFVKETYQGKDYVGYTCAACHTGQINFGGRALRIDGGPAMADMVGFLTELTRAMKLTVGPPGRENPRLGRFVDRVLALNNDYGSAEEVKSDLKKWTDARVLYNTVNLSTSGTQKVDYGYARLDAFGRIYNRVIQHAINKGQMKSELSLVKRDDGAPLLTAAQIDRVLEGVGELVLRDADTAKIVERLKSDAPGYPNLSDAQFIAVRDRVFNAPNAPVSYPFLWDMTHSDYVQWNGIASNALLGPLGRNAGEVVGVFAILDWQEDRRWFTRLTGFSFSALISGQDRKKKQIYFKSSVDLFNLQRLESHLSSLKSPRWPFCRRSNDDYYLPTGPLDKLDYETACGPDGTRFDEERRARGRAIYAERCVRCHDVIDRDDWDRLMVSNMLKVGRAGTDKAMAENSRRYKGKSGNLESTYQTASVGKVIVGEDAPVALILTAAVTGVLGTADPDKWWPRRFVEYVYALVMTLFDNPIKSSVKAGNYDPDTTAKPFKSIESYRARSLNGIWATAPYLHNGSVPSLWDLLLPAQPRGPDCRETRPKSFTVGAREFDPRKVGFKSDGAEGFKFDTTLRGNANSGHQYGPCMIDEERWDLIEYLKSL